MVAWVRMVVVVVEIDSCGLDIFWRQGQHEGYTKRLDVGWGWSSSEGKLLFTKIWKQFQGENQKVY